MRPVALICASSSRACRVLVIAVACVAALAGCSHKGKLKQPAKLVKIVNPQIAPQEVWSRSIGKGGGKFYSGLQVAADVDALYVAEIGGQVFALDPKTGKPIWKTATRARVIAGPTAFGDLVLVGTLDGQVIALKRSNGEQLWRAATSSEALAPPVGSGDIVVAESVDGRVYGLDATNGERRWSFDRNVPNLTLRGLSTPLILGNRVYIGFDSGKLIALNLADGQVAWEQTISVPTGRGDLDRLTDIDADLLPSPDGIFVVSEGGDLALVNTDTGDSRWRRSIKSNTGMALGGDKLFVTDADGLVWALDAQTGAAAWKQDAIKYRRLSPPEFYKGYVVVGDYKGYLHWLSPTDGSLVARTRLGSRPFTAPPVATGDLLYVMNVTGKLTAYDLAPPGAHGSLGSGSP